MTGCSFCGKPVDRPEEHHHNGRRTDNYPDNLRTAHRGCHMEHHGNDRAVDDHVQQRFGPRRPNVGPP